jgi:hypothetical protein
VSARRGTGGGAHTAGAATAAVVLAGTLLLAARPYALAGPLSRTALFAIGSAAIGLAALAVPAHSAPAHLARPGVLALGAGAVVLATLVAGTPVPVPRAAAALPLALLAAVAEEALFRRAAYGWLVRFGAPVAVVASAAMFALVHLPAYGVAAFPVDLGAGVLFSWQRWASGTWSTSAATHVWANLLAVLR